MDAEDREGRGWKNNLHCQTPKTQFENKLMTTAVYFFDPDESISAKREVGMQAKKGKRTCLLSTSSLAKQTIHGLLKEIQNDDAENKIFYATVPAHWFTSVCPGVVVGSMYTSDPWAVRASLVSIASVITISLYYLTFDHIFGEFCKFIADEWSQLLSNYWLDFLTTWNIAVDGNLKLILCKFTGLAQKCTEFNVPHSHQP